MGLLDVVTIGPLVAGKRKCSNKMKSRRRNNFWGMSATRIWGVLGGAVVGREAVELEGRLSTECFAFYNLDLRQMTKDEAHMWSGRSQDSDFMLC